MTTRRLTCAIDPARAAALYATLGQERDVSPGDALPPFFHQIYFWEPKPPGSLGPDGHPALGGFLPDMGFPRRMWAGGRLTFQRPLRAGYPATLTSRISVADRKESRAGPMALVTVTHDLDQNGPVLREEQDLVYLPADFARPAPRQAPDPREADQLRFTPTTLFRYSALTFNGHRIHYDRDYATGEEGYGGLVVHGP
ncbi:MAG: MaoC family dehydratase N-terminal domain-containing protein, partial [Pseudomonadota bacterium]